MYNDRDYFNIYTLVRDGFLTTSNNIYRKDLGKYDQLLRNMFGDLTDNKIISKYVRESLELIDRMKERLYELDPVLIDITKGVGNPFDSLTKLKVILFPKDIIGEDEGYGFGYFLSTFSKLLFEIVTRPYNYSFHYKKFDDLYKYTKTIKDKSEFMDNHTIITTILAAIYVSDLDYSLIDDYINNVDYYNDLLRTKGFILNRNNIDNYYSVMYKILFNNVDILKEKPKIIIK